MGVNALPTSSLSVRGKHMRKQEHSRFTPPIDSDTNDMFSDEYEVRGNVE